MSPNEVYQLPVQKVEKELWNLEEHFPECNYEDFQAEEVQGLETRVFHDENFDGERYWRLAGMYLDDKPFMIIQNAGRGGRDHTQRFITDGEVFLEAVKRIRKLTIPEDVVPSEEDLPELTNFYGCSLTSFYDPTVQPRYKVGDVVRALVLENHLNYSKDRVPTRVRITQVHPTHPKKTYFGIQLDRDWKKVEGKAFSNIMVEVEPGTGRIGAEFNDEQVLELLETQA